MQTIRRSARVLPDFGSFDTEPRVTPPTRSILTKSGLDMVRLEENKWV